MTKSHLLPEQYKAFEVAEIGPKRFSRKIVKKNLAELPPGDLLIRVHYTSLNYKDALSASGHRGVTKTYPFTPGIDAAGIIVRSSSTSWKAGTAVLVTGYDLGMNTPGGFGEYISVPAKWAVRLPRQLDMVDAMTLGTAGFTASQCTYHLIQQGLTPEDGPILITGASGGVGCLATAQLSKLGFEVHALTGKPASHSWLKELGAQHIIDRKKNPPDSSDRPLLKGKWAGVVDTVGGPYLIEALRSTLQRGVVTCCGLVSSSQLPLSIYPFILRGVRLIGIDSAQCPMTLRRKLWHRLNDTWKPSQLNRIRTLIPLRSLPPYIGKILQGRIQGRIVIQHETV